MHRIGARDREVREAAKTVGRQVGDADGIADPGFVEFVAVRRNPRIAARTTRGLANLGVATSTVAVANGAVVGCRHEHIAIGRKAEAMETLFGTLRLRGHRGQVAQVRPVPVGTLHRTQAERIAVPIADEELPTIQGKASRVIERRGRQTGTRGGRTAGTCELVLA